MGGFGGISVFYSELNISKCFGRWKPPFRCYWLGKRVLFRRMMDCRQNLIDYKRPVLNKQSCASTKQVILECIRLTFVFADAQDCKKWQKLVLNSNRLFSHCFRKILVEKSHHIGIVCQLYNFLSKLKLKILFYCDFCFVFKDLLLSLH